ncbi:Ldh family oxidoreductase [Labrenzia sp. OB1]|uniref:Ldh family oxidoreductase n=1 Tax=Labrenzia sp. OB1 TaxID=1561204 RepID=UPI0007B20ABC|nr:Ldh family oxidoreductase [Labrenzia sp. OB1]KZM51778.1 sulfolactate dehydrogenase [Labrenzia sp. OB1]
MEQTERVSLSDAELLIKSAFVGVGVPDNTALSVAGALVAAEAEGQVGHGFSRVEDYVAQVRSGKIAAGATVTFQDVGPTNILADAGFGFAYPALDQVIEQGGLRALEFGCATMGVTRSHHCGALSVQVEKLARKGLVAIMVANAPAAMAPFGAKKPVFGTNPIAFSAPRGDKDPLVIDLSLSRVARGKVMNARKAGRAIPEGWALDRHGDPTTDAEEALAGTMLPIGEAKGTALALMVEILASVMTGAAMSTEASSFFTADSAPPGVGQFLIAIRPMDQRFVERLESLLGLIEAMEGARLPGTRRSAAIREARAHGIDVPVRYMSAVRRLADGQA